MGSGPKTGGEPEQFGQCVECGQVYTVQETAEGEYRPIGREKACLCGNTEFVVVPEE